MPLYIFSLLNNLQSYFANVIIEIPDTIIKQSGYSESGLRLLIAIKLFEDEVFTLGQASNFANLHQIQFQKELASRNIPLHYGMEEYEQDKITIAKIKPV